MISLGQPKEILNAKLASISEEEESSINDGARSPSPHLLRPPDDFTDDDGKDPVRTLGSDYMGHAIVTQLNEIETHVTDGLNTS